MKQVSTKQISEIQKRIKKTNGTWHEGLTDRQLWVFLSTGMPHKPKYYWKEADSYIFHKQGNPVWVCVTKKFWEGDTR